MKPERLIDSTPTPEGDDLLLYERDGVFTLRNRFNPTKIE